MDGLQKLSDSEKDDDNNENQIAFGDEMNEEHLNEKESIGSKNQNSLIEGEIEPNENDGKKESYPDDEKHDSKTYLESSESSEPQTTASDIVVPSHESKSNESKPVQNEVDSIEIQDDKKDLGNTTTSGYSHSENNIADSPVEEKDLSLVNDESTQINIDLKEVNTLSNEHRNQSEQSITTKENVAGQQQNAEQTQKIVNTENSDEIIIPPLQSDDSLESNASNHISEPSSNAQQVSEISKTENQIIDSYVVNESANTASDPSSTESNVTEGSTGGSRRDEKEHGGSGDWTNVNVDSTNNNSSDEEIMISNNDITENTLNQINDTDCNILPLSSSTDADNSSPSSSAVLIENPFEQSFHQDENKNDDEIPNEISHDALDEDSNAKAEINQPNKAEGEEKATASPVKEVPQYMIDKFMTQLQRLDENHQAEISQMEKKHQHELDFIKSNQEMDITLKLEQAEEKIKGLESLLREREDEKKTTDKTIFNLKREVEKVEFKCAKL